MGWEIRVRNGKKGRKRPDMEQQKNIQFITEDLNPTFLFIWKGVRNRTSDSYHCHDHGEIAFVLSGTGKYRIEDEIYTVQEGDLLIFNPGVRHQAMVCPESETPTTEFFVGYSDLKLQGLPANALPVPEGEYMLHTAGELRQRLFKICSSMEAEKAVCKQGKYFMLKAYMIQILLLAIREQCEPMEKLQGCAFESVNRKYVVEQMLNYFEDHYSEKISLDQIAENMYLSPFYISKIFKSETGDTPIRHLINIRLEKAKELLEGGCDGSIQEVAASVGYDDAYHFSKLFKKHFGISPSQVRRKA